MSEMQPVHGVLLDIDGTLIASNDAHAHAWVEALAESGLPVPFAQVRPLIGMGGDKLIPAVTGLAADSPRGKQLSEARGKIFLARWLPTIRPYAMARQLVLRIRDHGLRVAIATSAEPDEVNQLLEVAHVRDLIDAKTSSGNGKRSKPDPDIVQAALARIGLDANQVVMIGDTPYDIDAARARYVRSIAFRTGGWPDRELASASEIYDGPADLLHHFATSLLSPFSRATSTQPRV